RELHSPQTRCPTQIHRLANAAIPRLRGQQEFRSSEISREAYAISAQDRAESFCRREADAACKPAFPRASTDARRRLPALSPVGDALRRDARGPWQWLDPIRSAVSDCIARFPLAPANPWAYRPAARRQRGQFQKRRAGRKRDEMTEDQRPAAPVDSNQKLPG